MIYDAATLGSPRTLRADLCVIGSGAGGGIAAMAAAEAGLSVVILEAGNFVPPTAMTQREAEMLPELLVANGGQTTTDRGVRVHQGRAVGGSTVHNINLCKRIPGPVLAEWRRTRGLEFLPPERWEALYDEVEALLGVGPVAPEQVSRHNRILRDGCEALGWEGGPVAHNRTGCVGSGFCLVGCAFDAKNNVPKVILPRAIRAGVEVLAGCQAVRVTHAGGHVTGVRAVALDPRTRRPVGEVVVEASRVCLAGSATGTPALLIRSGVPDPGGETGNTLKLHPALVAAGRFAEPVRAWEGIPQSWECTELLDFDAAHGGGPPPPRSRIWIVTAFAGPVGTATMMPGRGAAHAEQMAAYPHLAVLTGMLHDLTAGRVRPRGQLGWTIDYWPDEADRAELIEGLLGCARLLRAAGAEEVVIPTDPPVAYGPGQDLSAIGRLGLRRGHLDVTAVHPMASVPMGDDPKVAAVDSRGRHHHLGGLWIADGSLFCGSIGGPPQLSIYALGLHVGRAIAAAG